MKWRLGSRRIKGRFAVKAQVLLIHVLGLLLAAVVDQNADGFVSGENLLEIPHELDNLAAVPSPSLPLGAPQTLAPVVHQESGELRTE
jgi:hypothetical protein